jgi:hypothetical protein
MRPVFRAATKWNSPSASFPLDLEAVDLVSRDASAAGRHAIARCLTAHGSPLFSRVSLNQQPPRPGGSTTGSYQGPPATSGDEGLCLHFIGLVRSRNPAAVVRKSDGSNLEGTLSLGI